MKSSSAKATEDKVKKIILGLVIVLGISFCVVSSVNALSYKETGSAPAFLKFSGLDINCRDTDGGRDAYKKGTVCIGSLDTVWLKTNSPQSTSSCKTDECFHRENPYTGVVEARVREYYCGWGKVGYGYPQTEIAEVILKTSTLCQYGCENGACLRRATPSYTEGSGIELEDCVGDGETLRAGEGRQCCAGLHVIASGYRNATSYCTSEVCGNGQCRAKENEWNCPEDCATTTDDTSDETVVDAQSMLNMIKQAIEKFREALDMLENIITTYSTT